MRSILFKLNNLSYGFLLLLLKTIYFVKFDFGLSWYIFNLLYDISGQRIYYETEKNKLFFTKVISRFQKTKKNFLKFNKADTDFKVLKTLQDVGISKLESFKLDDNIVSNVNNYFKNTKYFYEGHIPIPENRKPNGQKPNSLYTSYDLTTQLNCSDLLKICLDKRLISLAQEYIGSTPRLYSLNTFKTLPSKHPLDEKHFTHEFHRDIDNIKWVVFFIFWTDTTRDNGGFQQIKYSHSHSKKLKDLIINKSSFNNIENFFKNTIPGYGLDEEYKKIFEDDVFHGYGKSGNIISCDTFGLHKGMPVQTPRLVTWIRYGSFISRQKYNKSPDLENKAVLNEKNKKLFLSSNYNSVLKDVVEIQK